MLSVLADPALASACDALLAGRYAIVPAFLPREAVAALAAEACRRDAAGDFRTARVGRGERREERTDVRGDRTLWLDEWAPATAEVALWAALKQLRIAVNEATMLGLFGFEGHYAIYPPGAFYRRHRDRFRDDDARAMSCVLYLNDGWTPHDGGALRIHVDSGAVRDILPVGGTLVCFPSERYEHEVLPARRERLSVTGWFLRRS
jgi:SM-20-related protein